MPHTYQRTIRLADTDAAGIVFFANYLVLCHEAYESALSAAGLPVQEFITSGDVIVPIAKSSVDYLRPLQCGDEVSVTVKPGWATAAGSSCCAATSGSGRAVVPSKKR